MKIKCVKMKCPVCNIVGLAQLFLNKKSEVRYARIRHYKGLNENKKPHFDYHKVEDLEALKTLLKKQELQFILSKSGQIGQAQTVNNIAPKPQESNLNFLLEPRAGFDPATITLPR